MKKTVIKNLADQLCEALPLQLKTLKTDIEKNFQSILSSTFNKLDLVTHEEFDAQTKVLLRTRQKLEMLEAKIKELEKLLKK